MSSWPGSIASGCRGTSFLRLETQRCLTSCESPSMDLGVNSPILLPGNVCFVTGSCCTGWDGSVIILRDSTTQALSGGVRDTASLQNSTRCASSCSCSHREIVQIMGKFRWKGTTGGHLVQSQLSKTASKPWGSLTQSLAIWRQAEDGFATHHGRVLVIHEPPRLGHHEGTWSCLHYHRGTHQQGPRTQGTYLFGQARPFYNMTASEMSAPWGPSCPPQPASPSLAPTTEHLAEESLTPQGWTGGESAFGG